MEPIINFFNKNGLALHHGSLKDYYPGSCDQCNMLNCGQKSIIYGLTPDLQLLVCDKCYEGLEPKIKDIISQLQKLTYFDKIPKDKHFEILTESGSIDSNWSIHPKYQFYIPKDNTVYVPMIKTDFPERWVSLRHFIIINDVKLI